MEHRPELDRAVAIVLRWGAYAAFVIMLAGLVSMSAAPSRVSLALTRAGVLVMMATPLLRLAVAMVAFLAERDYKYALASGGVLVIVLAGAVIGIG